MGSREAQQPLGGARGAEYLQVLVRIARQAAAVDIQRIVRGARGRRVARATKLLKRARAFHQERMAGRIKQVLRAWLDVRRRELALVCMRKQFVHWKMAMHRGQRKREFFRQSFWPLYVWRRYSIWSKQAKRKGIFLRRVWRTLIKLRHFRAMRRLVQLPPRLAPPGTLKAAVHHRQTVLKRSSFRKLKLLRLMRRSQRRFWTRHLLALSHGPTGDSPVAGVQPAEGGEGAAAGSAGQEEETERSDSPTGVDGGFQVRAES